MSDIRDVRSLLSEIANAAKGFRGLPRGLRPTVGLALDTWGIEVIRLDLMARPPGAIDDVVRCSLSLGTLPKGSNLGTRLPGGPIDHRHTLNRLSAVLSRVPADRCGMLGPHATELLRRYHPPGMPSWECSNLCWNGAGHEGPHHDIGYTKSWRSCEYVEAGKRCPSAPGTDGFCHYHRSCEYVDGIGHRCLSTPGTDGFCSFHRTRPWPVEIPIESQPLDPLAVKYDGVPLRVLLARDGLNRLETGHDRYPSVPPKLTPDQRAAVSAHWSAMLRAKVASGEAADRERERTLVTYCEVEPWE